MTPHDRWLEPDEDESNECNRCDGERIIIDESCSYSLLHKVLNQKGTIQCPNCGGTGIHTDAQRRQKAFDDFDPPDNDFGGLL